MAIENFAVLFAGQLLKILTVIFQDTLLFSSDSGTKGSEPKRFSPTVPFNIKSTSNQMIPTN
jgi:hypothetical protein